MGNLYSQGIGRMRNALLFAIILIPSSRLLAHPVSIIWIKAYAAGEQLTISCKVLAEDLTMFYDLSYDENFDYSVNELNALANSHIKTLTNQLLLSSKNEELLILYSKLVSSSIPTTGSINVMDLMRYELNYQLTYEIDIDWSTISFGQSFSEVIMNNAPVVCYFSFYEDQKLIVENQELKSVPFIVERGKSIAVQNPALSTSSYYSLGISGIYHELTLPVESLMSLMGISSSTNINATLVESYLIKSRNNVVADDSRLNVKCKDYILLTSEEKGQVYLNLYYPFEQLPSNISLTWTDYDWNLRWFDSKIRTLNADIEHRFSRYQPTIEIEGVSDIERKE